MAVSANQLIVAKEPGGRESAPVIASTNFYSGTLAFVVPATGHLTDVIATGANHFFGVVAEQANNSSGAAAAIEAECFQKGKFQLVGSGFTQAALGKKVYASDNYTITLTSTNNTLIGICSRFVSATVLEVDLRPGVP